MVYNDFYIGEDCDVDIVAGCGIHNSGCDESRHDGVHTFYVGKNSHVHYSEKHYGEGDGNGKNVMNPQTIVYLEEGASIQMDTVQIRGIDSTKRYTKIVCGKDAEGVVTERLLTHGHQEATSDMEIVLDGEKFPRARHFPFRRAGRVQPALLSPHGRQREVLRSCAVRLHHHGQREDPLHSRDRGELHGRPAHSRGRHRQDRRRPAPQAQTLGLTAEEAEDTILKGFLA